MKKKRKDCKLCGKQKVQREGEAKYNFEVRKYCSKQCLDEATKAHRATWGTI